MPKGVKRQKGAFKRILKDGIQAISFRLEVLTFGK